MNTLIILAASYLYLVAIAYAAVVVLKSTPSTRMRIAKFSLLALPLGYLLTKLAGVLWYDPRPFVTNHVLPLIAHVPDNGFPSDHTVLTMTIACIIVLYSRRSGYVLFSLALLVGIARILAGLHHPIDVIGSIGIAVIATIISVIIAKRVRWLRQ